MRPSSRWGEKGERPGGAAGFRLRASGAARWTGPPLVECRALACCSTCSHRPSRLAAWRAMPRSDSTPVSRPRTRRHRSTLTRLPEPSVLVPIGTVLPESSWGGPSSSGSYHCSVACTSPGGDLHARLPRPNRSPGVRVAPLPSRTTPAGLRSLVHPEVAAGRWTRRSSRLPVTLADSSLPPISRRSSSARSEVAVNTVHSDSASLVSGVGWAEAPSSPLRLRALSGTSISQDATKALVKGYFEIHRVIPATFSLPPGFRPSSTRCPPFVHSNMHREGTHSELGV